MSQHNVAVNKSKCQSFGRCVALVPEAFRLDADRKVDLIETAEVADERVLKAARGCPYRAITITDNASGEQIFPPVRK